MSAEARRIARRARRLGYVATGLGNATESHWDALRILLEAEDASLLELADAVDLLIADEEESAQVRGVV